jgi:hypothetical protein
LRVSGCVGRWRPWDNFFTEVTHLSLLNLCQCHPSLRTGIALGTRLGHWECIDQHQPEQFG